MTRTLSVALASTLGLLASQAALACPAPVGANICQTSFVGVTAEGFECDLTANGGAGAASIDVYTDAAGDYCADGVDAAGGAFAFTFTDAVVSANGLIRVSVTGSAQNDLIRLHDGGGLELGPSGVTPMVATAVGGAGNDTMRGSATATTTYDEKLDGEGWADHIRGRAGSDTLVGGPGNDRMFGDDGNDLMDGGPGDDEMHGGRHRDEMYGGDGHDDMHGEHGHDDMYGDAGDDTMSGGPGMDDMYGGNDADCMMGDGQDDVMFGDAGDDRMFGDLGADTLSGDAGNDGLSAGGQLGDTEDGGAAFDHCTIPGSPNCEAFWANPTCAAGGGGGGGL